MKFTIEINDESINEDNIKYEVANHLAGKVYQTLNLDWIKKQANEELEKKKKICLDEVKTELKSWDKSSMVFELQSMMEKSWINQVAEKIVEKLKNNPVFIGKVSSEIIKSKFK